MRKDSDLYRMGERLLNGARTELYLGMRFMGPALSALPYELDPSARPIGTDAYSIRFNPLSLMQIYLEHPYILNRIYLHLVLHCLFRHMFSSATYADKELWNLCSDIAVESVIDSMDVAAVNRTPSDYREECYRELKEAVGVLTAERLFFHFLENPPEYTEQLRMAREFRADDHSYWEEMQDQAKNEERKNPEYDPEELDKKSEEWRQTAKRARTEMNLNGTGASHVTGTLDSMLTLELREKTGYSDLLRHFAVLREENRVDPDSFDYAFYNLGFQLYGNMPLIEENEYTEVRKIRQLVIAIDTSASCPVGRVQRFLEETAAILLDRQKFFNNVEIHIIECDTKVEEDVLILSHKDMDLYAKNFHVKGGGGTDFRPVFDYVDELRRKGSLSDLRGLIYFTDGYGFYPKKAPQYETAFVLWKDDAVIPANVPDWAIKAYLEE